MYERTTGVINFVHEIKQNLSISQMISFSNHSYFCCGQILEAELSVKTLMSKLENTIKQ